MRRARLPTAADVTTMPHMSSDVTSEKRETASSALLAIGSIGPLGHVPASGTVTVAVVGLPCYYLLSRDRLSHVPWPAYLIGLAAFALASVWIHARGDALLGEKDSRKLVWDELVGFFVAVALVPFTWQLAAVAFVLERVLDIVKFPPANWVERHWPGGWGVVGDDVVAGVYTCALLHLGVYYLPGPLGL